MCKGVGGGVGGGGVFMSSRTKSLTNRTNTVAVSASCTIMLSVGITLTEGTHVHIALVGCSIKYPSVIRCQHVH